MRAIRVALVAAAAFFAAPTFAAIAPASHATKHPTHVAKHSAKHSRVARHVAKPDDGVSVPMDEARVITFKQPVSTVFVGNPYIADVTMIDSRHAYLLGKTFGATNLIGLNAQHTPVVNTQINVSNRQIGAVTLNRGADTYNYSCTRARCETSPRPGDPLAYVNNTEDAATKHQDEGSKAASVASAQ